MVESLGDGVKRPFKYGHFRDDIPQKQGYSKEMVSALLEPEFYNNIEELPLLTKNGDTLLKQF
jgi:hypothetical protein